MDPLITEYNQFLQKIILQLKEDLKTIRSGRANPAILEGIIVETYGGQTKLKLMELSSITTEGPNAIVITPYDPSTITDIEKSLLKSPLGISPQTTGSKITVRIPPLSQEQREKYTKVISQKVEEKRMIIRNQRDEVRKKIRHQFEAKSLTEDIKFRLEKEIDTTTQKSMSELQIIKEKKEKEIMEV